jgi:hypothetical protein
LAEIDGTAGDVEEVEAVPLGAGVLFAAVVVAVVLVFDELGVTIAAAVVTGVGTVDEDAPFGWDGAVD